MASHYKSFQPNIQNVLFKSSLNWGDTINKGIKDQTGETQGPEIQGLET